MTRYDQWEMSPRPQTGVSQKPAPPVSPVQRLHRRLVRLGWALLAAGPALGVIHAITDVLLGGTATWWTYTIAGYDTALIVMIIGTALVCRSTPDEPE
ncbi:hypothetical protein [Microbacterium esteraromaticum]|uniref:hypothetical protein n=1 Tax=Microbacterium esteraromaticum TaxID=57043 RepID=UPI00195C99B9|nr:hypothetical protein [Microbacterium esteraromaticum]MBM7465268.1 hypothetical protein [Microbacterium esteraromaticum]